jgi:hypothetical protein
MDKQISVTDQEMCYDETRFSPYNRTYLLDQQSSK